MNSATINTKYSMNITCAIALHLYAITLFCQTHQTRQKDASDTPDGATAAASEMMRPDL